MNIKTFCLTGTLLLLSIGTYAQKKKETINDSNTPLHLLQPEYKVIIVTCLPMPNWNAAPSAWPVMSGELLIQL